MSKIYIILAILSVMCAVSVKGFDKNEAIAQFMAKVDECKPEVGASESDLQELVGKKPASTMEGKCLRSCLMKKYQVMDSNGKFVRSTALSHAEKYTDGSAAKMKIANEIMEACDGITVSDDHCEAAEEYGKCFKEQLEAHGIKDDFEF